MRRAKFGKIIFEEEEDQRPDPASLLETPQESSVDITCDFDPLDAFMASIDEQIEQSASKPRPEKPDFDELLADDPMEVYLEGKAKERLRMDAEQKEKEDIENAVRKQQALNEEAPADKFVPMVPPLDFREVELEPFKKKFYTVNTAIASLTKKSIQSLRKEMEIEVQGEDVPAPCTSFGYFGLHERIIDNIATLFTKPTAIQSQAVPVVLSGRDILGLAKTGSGKTCAFVWPLLHHVLYRIKDGKSNEPMALIVAPTRELAQQIYTEVVKFSKGLGIDVAPIYGGMNLHDQVLLLQGHKKRNPRCDVVICTPGRIIDHLKKKHVSFMNVSMVVLDECDRMLQMGFEPQVHSIVGQIRPDRQMLMFSATFAPKLIHLADQMLDNPVQIAFGAIGSSNTDVRQELVLLKTDEAKWPWLKARIKVMVSKGPVLIFAGTKVNCVDLGSKLSSIKVESGVIHGDKLQSERQEVMQKFRNREIWCLVSTDVAARGLDIDGLDVVINYDIARDIDSHVHRIGRTGRAGRLGTAFTLISKQNPGKLLPMLVDHLKEGNQQISKEIEFFSEKLLRSEESVEPPLKKLKPDE